MASDDILSRVGPAWAAASRSPFHQERLDRAGVRDLPASVAEFQRRVPFTRKSDLVADQAAHPPYGRVLTEPLPRYTRCHQTSGTTGAPLRWLDTPESWDAMVQDWVDVLRAAGVVPGDRILFAFSFGPFLGFWLAFEAAQRIGALCFAGGGMGSSVRLRVLLENECTVLCCTPTYALHLPEVARADGLNLESARVRRIVVAGEPGGSLPAVRARLASLWNGAQVFDHHGMTETGPVTLEDPAAPGTLQLLKNSFLAEVVHPETGQPVAPGDTGELILTTLRRLGSPLLRYRTGDLVRRDSAPIPQRFPGGILGRVDDMVIVRGVNVYPSALDEIVRSIPEVGEYRATLDTRSSLVELGLEVEASETAAAELSRRIQRSLSLRVPVQSVGTGTLPRFELKARRWRRL
ncbi:MAG: AMP-binding protein [Verrucomicrobiales bacterium]|nr:AMP-binding protein [Verrucomicrobiales bacterium]